MVSSLVDCMISHGDITINEGDVYEAQHGYSFIVILNHMRDIMTRAAAGYASASFFEFAVTAEKHTQTSSPAG